MWTKTLTVVALAMVVAGCGSSSSYNSNNPSPTPIAPGPNTVLVPSGTYLGPGPGFSPNTITVAAGTTVMWGNNDVTAHTTTSDTGLWNSSNINPNGTFSLQFNNPGTYTYHCSIHAFMTGKVVVQ